MRLVYFASPYELLDVDRPGQDRQFTRQGTYNKIRAYWEVLPATCKVLPPKSFHRNCFQFLLGQDFWEVNKMYYGI